MSVKISILCENTVGRPIPAIGEHGFACLIESSRGTWLFDTGRGEALLHNMGLLGHDPHDIKGIILSHGHNDHAGGLLSLLKKIGPRPVYAHPDLFTVRFWQGLHERRNISMPNTKKELLDAGANFVFLKQMTEIETGLFFSGFVPRKQETETGDPHLVRLNRTDQTLTSDALHDDVAVAVQSKSGLILLLGCAHAGLINTIEHFRLQLPATRIHAIIGGTHLGPASEQQFQATVDYLDQLAWSRLGVSHCTGQARSAQLYARYPKKVFFASIGTTFEA